MTSILFLLYYASELPVTTDLLGVRNTTIQDEVALRLPLIWLGFDQSCYGKIAGQETVLFRLLNRFCPCSGRFWGSIYTYRANSEDNCFRWWALRANIGRRRGTSVTTVMQGKIIWTQSPTCEGKRCKARIHSVYFFMVRERSRGKGLCEMNWET